MYSLINSGTAKCIAHCEETEPCYVHVRKKIQPICVNAPTRLVIIGFSQN